jgi:hypothetical protein
MKIHIIKEVTVTEKTGRVRECKVGDTASVYHVQGRRLIYGNFARWIGMEPSDPFWEPVPYLRAILPKHDTMIRKALNKGAA